MAKAKRRRGRSIKERIEHQVKTRDDDTRDFRPVLDFSNAKKKPANFKPQKGKQRISILPYTVSGNNHPDLKEGDMDYKLQIYIHQGVGVNNDSIICMNRTFGKPCYICEERKRLMDDGYEWDSDEVAALGSSKRCWYNVEVPGQEDKGVQIWHKASWKNFEKRLCSTAEEDYEEIIIFADLEAGAYVDFKGVENSFGKIKYIDFENFSLKERPELSEDKLDEVYQLDDLLIIPTYEEVKALFLGMDTEETEKSDDEEEETEEKEEKPKTSRRKPKKEAEEADDDCPFHHTFGTDCNKTDDCDDCDEEIFTKCLDAQENMESDTKGKKKFKRK